MFSGSGRFKFIELKFTNCYYTLNYKLQTLNSKLHGQLNAIVKK